MMTKCMKTIAAAVLAISAGAVGAQDRTQTVRQHLTDHSQHSVPMDHSTHGSSSETDQGKKPAAAPSAQHDAPGGRTGSEHGEMSMQGGRAPPDARDPHAYSGGYDRGPYPLHMADEHNFASLLVDRLEGVRADGETAAEYDLQAWFGRDYNRAVLKAEGDVDDGKLQDARTELLWGHAVAAYWDAQLGVRVDSGEGPNRTWLAFGVQGLAPYWFEVEASGYAGENGRTALRVQASYELLFTQRLVLQPRLEANFFGKSDVERGLESGLSDATAGLRLRYEIWREFAPYVGVEWARKFGGTEDIARAAGDDPRESRVVAGLRFWF